MPEKDRMNEHDLSPITRKDGSEGLPPVATPGHRLSQATWRILNTVRMTNVPSPSEPSWSTPSSAICALPKRREAHPCRQPGAALFVRRLAPSSDPYASAAPAPDDVAWLEPISDGLVLDERADPAQVAAVRQTVRLALVAAAQILPPRQRAAFFLCDVLDQPGAEAAAVLGVSVAALKSLLQRARARLEQQTVADEELAEPTDERARLVLDRYIAAFEQSDVAAMERLLADDAILEMTGTATWFSGKATCVPFIAAQAIGQAGDWRMVPLHANGQLAVGAYHLDDRDSYHPFAIVVLATTLTHLTRISLFVEPALFSRFGLPPTITAGHGLATGI